MAEGRWSRVRDSFARPDVVRRAYGRARRELGDLAWRLRDGSFATAPPERAVRMVYNVMLRREPDPGGQADFMHRLGVGAITRDHMVEEIRGSEEFIYGVRFNSSLGHSIHAGRAAWIQSLPPATRILDLGGTHKYTDEGALLRMGYPYTFDELIIVDLPDDDRHEVYRVNGTQLDVETASGPVRHRYHSMVDLSSYPDASFDLVYSGQSIEHITESEADIALAEVRRVLRPGGHFALDTPNGRITRRQQAEFIDPDHKIEYTHEALAAKLRHAGFDILEAKGLNYVGNDGTDENFSLAQVAQRPGLFAAAPDCYILTFLCARDSIRSADTAASSPKPRPV